LSKTARERMDVVAAYETVGTYRGAAEICGTTHKTVKRIVEAHQAELAGELPVERSSRGHNYDEVAELVAERANATSGRISAKRLLSAARAAGYAGSPRNFRRLVAEAKQEWRRDHHRGRRPGVWLPGETLLIDWGMLAGLHVFCAVLAWSRVRFIRFADNERATTTFELLAECFEVLGGVPAVVLADRMGCLKAGVVANVVVPSPDYVRFATHYGFRPDFCHGRDPESKGMVENLVGYAKSDLMVPQLPFCDLWTANDAAEAWCNEVNAVKHSEICAVPSDRLVKELELLRPLPSLRPEVGIKVISRKVDKLSCIRFASARYSVPCRLIGYQVTITTRAGALTVIEPMTGEVLAEHRLVGPGEISLDHSHYDRPRPDKPRRAPRPRTQAEKDFCGLGPAAEAFLVGAAAAGVSKLGTELADINSLVAAHGPDAVVAALIRATEYRRWRAGDIRSILATAGAAPTPRPAGDPLAEVLTLPSVPTRSLDAYKITTGAVEDGDPSW
jgi:transposase